MAPPLRRRSRRPSRVVITALAANFGITVAKFVAFGLTGSASMLAESLHSLADTGNQGLMLWGERRSLSDPDRAHPFGYGRERYFWAFVVAVVLFALGSLFSLVEAEEKLRQPRPIESPAIALLVLAIAACFESVSLRAAVRQARPRLGGGGWFRFVRRTKTAELPVVLLEDTGALIGLAFAALGVVLAWTTGIDRFDAVGSLAIGLLLGAIAMILATEMKSLLIGEAASDELLAELRRRLLDDDAVVAVRRLRSLHLGPDEVLVIADVTLADAATISVADAEERARRLAHEVDDAADPSVELILTAQVPEDHARGAG